MQKVNAGQRRARLGLRHHLAREARADDVTTMVHGLLALHATDPASVFRSSWARLANAHHADIEAALYEARTLIRLKAMRGTLFVVPVALLPVMNGAFSQKEAKRERARLVKILTEASVAQNVEAWLTSVEQATLEALHARKEAHGRELSGDVPELRTSFVAAEGKKWASKQNITTWVLNLLSAEGRIVRGRPLGTWASGQYRWVALDDWLPSERPNPPEPDEARAELIRSWLDKFGPGTVEDIKWWTGFTLGQVRQALANVGVVEVDLDGQAGVALADDLDPVPEPAPWVALLPPLDSTGMGWKDRTWYLSDQAKAQLFDRNGNIGPTVWCNGRVVGGWSQRSNEGATDNMANGAVTYRLFEDIGRDLTDEVAEQAARLDDWHGGVRVAPRGRVLCPLEQELSA